MDEIKNIEDKFQLLIDIIPDNYQYLIPIEHTKVGYKTKLYKHDVIKWKQEVASCYKFHNHNRMIWANLIWKDIHNIYTSQPKNKP